MWKLVFDGTTKVGVTPNREPMEGEIGIELPPEKCKNFAHEPWRYKLEGKELVENKDLVEAEAKIQEEVPVISLESIVARIEALESKLNTKGV